ncbi:MAG TPA: LytTR family DNA-binding domain-containing protein [Longimicrobium sp.]|nr:LytTR family DNA-binding domain-containing protein [Longimicrobium sp.]
MDAPIRVLIVDDEELGRRRVGALLAGDPGVRVVGECEDGASAVEAITRLRPDLVFLDVQMPRLDGLGVVREVGVEEMPVVIFVTAYDEFALRAFEANAQDYLLKPFDNERFEAALSRARRVVRHRRTEAAVPGLRALLESLPDEERYPERFLVKTGEHYVFVRAADVDWVEAADNYVALHVGARKYLLRDSLNSFARRLSPRRFLRVRRSAIINLDRVAALRVYSGTEYEVTLSTGVTLVTGRSYRDQVRAALFS